MKKFKRFIRFLQKAVRPKSKEPKAEYLVCTILKDDNDIELICPVINIEALPFAENEVRNFFEHERDQDYTALISQAVAYQDYVMTESGQKQLEEGVELILESPKIKSLHIRLYERFKNLDIKIPRSSRFGKYFKPKIRLVATAEKVKHLIGKRITFKKAYLYRSYNGEFDPIV